LSRIGISTEDLTVQKTNARTIPVPQRKNQMIKVGDKITYRGGFGSHPPKQATIEAMEVTDYPRSKDGDDVDEVDESLVRENRVLFVLDDGHWCYSEQVIL
jgi:hypothetical protein